MQKELQEIADQQRAAWNKFSPGWKKWDDFVMSFLKPMGDKIIDLIKPADGENILDIAAGTGEPGLSIAAIIPNGKVTITDLAEDMLSVAKENAEKKSVLNVEFKTADVSELPFADNTFDAISCRMGFMFFPDMQMAASEINRVLKPGGRFATSVWNGPEKNYWVTAMASSINQNMQLQPPPPGSPGMFRCADNNMMMDILKKAGFMNVDAVEVTSKVEPGTAEGYWTMQTELAAPFVAALSKADDPMRAKIKAEVIQKINDKFPDGNVAIDTSSWVLYGEKPVK
jgi:ubiquinone/menaquinone biosynthesis C-methylase UbiE